MHEIAIATAIVEQIEEHPSVPYGMVRTVRVKIGALSAVVPSALQFAWELATEGTAAQGAELIVEHVPLTIDCATCGEQVVDGFPIPVCPRCGVSSRSIVAGRELEITSLEVVDADPIG